MRNLVFVFCFISIAINLFAQQELGHVKWLRDYDTALSLAVENDKPVLILFQEVPGCATCKNYGNNVLSNPLLVDIIEHYFIPLAIFNNKKGEDLRILKQYNEPTWNNPVIRIVDKYGENIHPRLAGNYTLQGIVNTINTVLLNNHKIPPKSLSLLSDISIINPDSELTLSMYCFWSGEKEIAKIDGVYATEAGFLDGKEVVRISYDSNITSKKKIVNQAHKSNNAKSVYDNSKGFRADKDPKYYLKNSEYKYLAFHPYQAAKINSLLGQGMKSIDEYLFPTQRAFINKIRSKDIKPTKLLYNNNLNTAWKEMKDQL